MAIVKKSLKAEKQLNIKITMPTRVRYEAVKKACLARNWGFTLYPDFEAWLNTQLAAAEKELAAAEKVEAK